MNFSIIIPTLENYRYLENCINSITKNSTFDHEIIVHLNGHCNSSENFLKEKKISYTKSLKNIGLCSAVNIAAKKLKIIKVNTIINAKITVSSLLNILLKKLFRCFIIFTSTLYITF